MDYFPYSEELRSFTSPLGSERYKTTHHERDRGTGLDYRGARYYDAALGRFLSVDPLAADFASWSTYNYVLGNPLRFIDPDGRSADDIIVDGIKYEIGATGEGESEFVQQTFAALNQIANGDDKQASDLVNYFATTDEYNIEITEAFRSQAHPRFAPLGEGGKDIALENQGIDFNPTQGIAESSTNMALSPDVALLHELGHIKNAIDDPEGFNERYKTPDSNWRNLEEKYNIQKWEIPYSRSRGMLERSTYSKGLSIIKTINSTNAITPSQFIIRSTFFIRSGGF